MELKLLYLLLVLSFLGVDAAVFTLQNRCGNTVWPGIQGGEGKAPLMNGKGTCLTGDCGGNLECSGAGGAPPSTLAEFTLDSPVDYYDISLVDGYNMPVSIIPLGVSSSCKTSRCLSDINQACPEGLQVRKNRRVVACKSACLAFNTPEYCCTGEYSNPQTCRPSNYSNVFKDSCPLAYTYAYDDPSSLFTCEGADYLIRFC
uniref:Thaumatin-like protein n=1 Tax=Fagus sylvatica TaxID=28930 RepID=A0A2N9FHQ7_FAGSY